MSKKLLTWLLLVCLGYTLQAQDRTGSVTGIVRNDQGDPLSGVTVLASNSERDFHPARRQILRAFSILPSCLSKADTASLSVV